MKKAFKILAVLAATVVGVIVLASVALRFFLPPEKAKALIQKQLTSQLHREVTLGQVSVGIISGLDVADLKISEKPDFSKGTFVSSDRFVLKLALLPLIFKRVEVRELVLTHPVINVVRRADGTTFNFSDLMTSASPPTPLAKKEGGESPRRLGEANFLVSVAYAAPAPAAEQSAFLLTVANAQIHNGEIRFVDQSPSKQSVDIDALELKVRDVSLSSPFSLQASLKAKSRGATAALKVAGDADLATGSFKIKNCELSSGGSSISLTGLANHLKTDRPSADLDLTIKEFRFGTLAAFADLPPDLKLEGPIIGQAKIQGDQKKMNLSGMLDLQKVQIAYGKTFSKPAQVPLGIAFRGDVADLKNLNIANLKTVLGPMQLTWHGKVLAINSAQPQFNLHGESNAPFPLMDVAKLFAVSLPAGMTCSGNASISADVSGTQTSSHIAVKLNAKDLAMAYADKFVKPAGTPTHLSVVGEVIQPPSRSGKKSASGADQVINLQNIAASIGGIQLGGTGSIQSPRIQLALKSNSFSLQELSKMVPLIVPYKLNGNAQIDLKTSGTTAAPQTRGSLTLENASLQYEKSTLTGIDTAMTFTDQDVNIPKLTGKLNGSDLTLKLTGRRLTTHPDIDLEGKVAELDLNKLLPPPAPSSPAASGRGSMDEWGVAWAAPAPAAEMPMDLAGHLIVGRVKHEFYNAQNLDIKWDLTNFTTDLSRVSGTVDVRQGAGKLEELEKLSSSSKGAHIALLPLEALQKLDKIGALRSLGLPSLKTIPFESIRGDYTLRSGTMDIKTCELIGTDISIFTQGSAGLSGEQLLNLLVTARLRPGIVRGTVGQIFSDDAGRVTLAFKIKGSMANPDVKPDFSKSAEKAVGGLLRGLTGQSRDPKQAPAAPAPTSDAGQAAPPPPPPPDEKPDPAKEIENAFKKLKIFK